MYRASAAACASAVLVVCLVCIALYYGDERGGPLRRERGAVALSQHRRTTTMSASSSHLSVGDGLLFSDDFTDCEVPQPVLTVSKRLMQ